MSVRDASKIKKIGELSARVSEMRRQPERSFRMLGKCVSQIFILPISNVEKILSNILMVVRSN